MNGVRAIKIVVNGVKVVKVGRQGPPGPPGPGTGPSLTPAQRAAWMGIWFGTQVEYDVLDAGLKKTYAQWLASGTGYFEFHILPASDSTTHVVSAPTAGLSLAGGTPAIVIHRMLTVPAAEMPLSGNIPAVSVTLDGAETILLDALTADISLSSPVPTVSRTLSVTGVTADMSLLTPVPGINNTWALAGVTADYALAGNIPDVAVVPAGPETILLDGLTADMVLSTPVPVITRTRVLAGITANLTLTGNVPASVVPIGFEASLAPYTSSASPATVQDTSVAYAGSASARLVGGSGSWGSKLYKAVTFPIPAGEYVRWFRMSSFTGTLNSEAIVFGVSPDTSVSAWEGARMNFSPNAGTPWLCFSHSGGTGQIVATALLSINTWYKLVVTMVDNESVIECSKAEVFNTAGTSLGSYTPATPVAYPNGAKYIMHGIYNYNSINMWLDDMVDPT